MFEPSYFFGTRVYKNDSLPERPLTIVRVPEQTKDGAVIVSRCLEHEMSGKQALDYQDYQINALLAAGIKPTAIHLKNDIRIGSDKVVKAFNDRVDELSEKMFNS